MTNTAAQSASLSPAMQGGAALPQHIAIIMDGNGRWARERGMSLVVGHSQGGEAIRALIKGCKSRPYIKYLTLYAFSLENWKRSINEVNDLMNLVRHFIKREAPVLTENNICMRFIGELDILSEDIRKDLAEIERISKDNTALTVSIAISYGGRQEMTTATKRIAAKVAAGTLKPEEITDETVAAHLHTAGTPDPDLIIRTGGETRLSNFLLWQSAYTELYFDPVLWPDYTPAHLDRAVEVYGSRERRYGGRKEA